MKSWREIQAKYEHIEDMPPLDREVYEEAMELNRQERYERDHHYTLVNGELMEVEEDD